MSFKCFLRNCWNMEWEQGKTGRDGALESLFAVYHPSYSLLSRSFHRHRFLLN